MVAIRDHVKRRCFQLAKARTRVLKFNALKNISLLHVYQVGDSRKLYCTLAQLKYVMVRAMYIVCMAGTAHNAQTKP